MTNQNDTSPEKPRNRFLAGLFLGGAVGVFFGVVALFGLQELLIMHRGVGYHGKEMPTKQKLLAKLLDKHILVENELHADGHYTVGPATDQNGKPIDPKGMDDQALEYLARLQSLDPNMRIEFLSFDCKYVTNNGLANLGQLPHLHSLGLSGGKSITDDGFAFLAELDNLKTVGICDAPTLNGSLLRHLASPQTLESLELKRTSLTDENVRLCDGMTALKYIDFSETPITNKSLTTLDRLSFSRIDIPRTKIPVEAAEALARDHPDAYVYGGDEPPYLIQDPVRRP